MTPQNQLQDPLSPSSLLSEERKVNKEKIGISKPSNDFGASRPSHTHEGIDIPGSIGDSILSPADAEVTFAGWQKGYGKVVYLKHPDGTTTRYGHLSGFQVEVGDRLKAGVPIGLVGQTGNAKGPHVHYERRDEQGLPMDPLLQELFPSIGGKEYDPLSPDSLAAESDPLAPQNISAGVKGEQKGEGQSRTSVEIKEFDPSTIKDIPFTPEEEDSPSFYSEAARRAISISRPNYKLPTTHPDQVGKLLTIKIPSGAEIPDSNTVVDSFMSQLGPEALSANQSYREQTGRNLGFPEQNISNLIQPTSDGGYEIKVQPTQRLIRSINSFNKDGMFGLLLEKSKMDREKWEDLLSQSKKARESSLATIVKLGTGGMVSPEGVDKGVAKGVIGNSQFLYNLSMFAEAVSTKLRYGVDSPEYKQLEQQDAENQKLINDSLKAVGSSSTIPGQITEGVISQGVELPQIFAAGGNLPVSTYVKHMNQGQVEAGKAAILSIPMQALFHFSGAAGAELPRYQQEIIGRSLAGGFGAATTPGGWEERSKAFATGALLPIPMSVGKAKPTGLESLAKFLEMTKEFSRSKEGDPVSHARVDVDGKPIAVVTKDGKVIVENDQTQQGFSKVTNKKKDTAEERVGKIEEQLPGMNAEKRQRLATLLEVESDQVEGKLAEIKKEANQTTPQTKSSTVAQPQPQQEVLAHIAGPSGSGKTEIMEALAKKVKNINFKDLDEFDDLAVSALGWEYKSKNDYSEDMLQQLHEKKQELIDEYLRTSDKPVVFFGHHVEADRELSIPAKERILLDVSPRTSALNAARRPGKTQEDLTNDIKIGEEDVNYLKARGYQARNPRKVYRDVMRLSQETSQPQQESEVSQHIRKVFDEPSKMTSGGRIVAYDLSLPDKPPVRFSLVIKGNTADVAIGPPRGEFLTETDEGTYKVPRTELGVETILEVKRFLQTKHPEITELKFERSGSTGGEYGRKRVLKAPDETPAEQGVGVEQSPEGEPYPFNGISPEVAEAHKQELQAKMPGTTPTPTPAKGNASDPSVASYEIIPLDNGQFRVAITVPGVKGLAFKTYNTRAEAENAIKPPEERPSIQERSPQSPLPEPQEFTYPENTIAKARQLRAQFEELLQHPDPSDLKFKKMLSTGTKATLGKGDTWKLRASNFVLKAEVDAATAAKQLARSPLDLTPTAQEIAQSYYELSNASEASIRSSYELPPDADPWSMQENRLVNRIDEFSKEMKIPFEEASVRLSDYNPNNPSIPTGEQPKRSSAPSLQPDSPEAPTYRTRTDLEEAQSTIERLHSNPARVEGLGNVSEARAKAYFRQLRAATERYRPDLTATVDAAERSYYSQQIGESATLSEQALSKMHQTLTGMITEDGAWLRTPEEVKEWGSRNKIITKETADQAKSDLNEIIKGGGSNDITQVFGRSLTPLIKLGAYHIEAGAREFSDWVKALAADLSAEQFDILGPYLSDLYAASKSHLDSVYGPAAVKKVNALIKEAKPIREETEKLYTSERGKRLQGFSTALQNLGGGEVAAQKALSALGGKLPSAPFEPVRQSLSQAETDALYSMIANHPDLGQWEKVKAVGAVRELLNPDVTIAPSRSNLAVLEKVYGKQFVKSILSMRSKGQIVWEEFLSFTNIPRTILASFDLSAPFRQGAILSAANPIKATRSFVSMLKAFGSPEYADQVMKSIESSPNAKAREDAGLYLSHWGAVGDSAVAKEEFYQLTGVAENVLHSVDSWLEGKLSKQVGQYKLGYKGILASERAYLVYLNKLRSDVFDGVLNSNPNLTKADLKGVATFINYATGRGDLGMLEQAAPILNNLFFSPRFALSRFQVAITPFYGGTKASKAYTAKSLVKFVGAGIGVLALAKVAGLDTDLDPRSAKFGKIQIGNTYIDVWGGMQQPARYVAQILLGQRKTVQENKIATVPRDEVIVRFGRSKESPQASFIHDIYLSSLKKDKATGESYHTDFVGNPVTPGSAIRERVFPLAWRDIYDAVQEDRRLGGSGVVGGLTGSLGLFGFGITTIPPKGVNYDPYGDFYTWATRQ